MWSVESADDILPVSELFLKNFKLPSWSPLWIFIPLPDTSSVSLGFVVPIPTFPSFFITKYFKLSTILPIKLLPSAITNEVLSFPIVQSLFPWNLKAASGLVPEPEISTNVPFVALPVNNVTTPSEPPSTESFLPGLDVPTPNFVELPVNTLLLVLSILNISFWLLLSNDKIFALPLYESCI